MAVSSQTAGKYGSRTCTASEQENASDYPPDNSDETIV
jgi:hypothetical protein